GGVEGRGGAQGLGQLRREPAVRDGHVATGTCTNGAIARAARSTWSAVFHTCVENRTLFARTAALMPASASCARTDSASPVGTLTTVPSGSGNASCAAKRRA